MSQLYPNNITMCTHLIYSVLNYLQMCYRSVPALRKGLSQTDVIL